MTSITALKVPIFPQQNGAPRAPSPTRAANATWLLLQINRLIDELDVILTALMDEEGSFWTVEDRAALSTSLATIVGGINGHSAQITVLQTTQGTQGQSLTDQASQIIALQTAQGTQGQSLTDQASQITALQTAQGTQGQSLTDQASQINALQTTQGTQGQSLTDQASQINALQTAQGMQGQALTGQASQINALQTTQETHTSQISGLQTGGQEAVNSLTVVQQTVLTQGQQIGALELTDNKRASLLVYGPAGAANAVGLSKGQLQFPSTQQPSANPRTLDDYLEFTWMPDLRFGNAAVGMVYGSRSGIGVKIGRFIQIWWSITLTAKGNSSGSAQIYGLPYTADTVPVLQAGFHVNTQVFYRLNAASAIIDLLTTANAAIAQNTITNTSVLTGSLQFLTTT
jgi:hypothetical protein